MRKFIVKQFKLAYLYLLFTSFHRRYFPAPGYFFYALPLSFPPFFWHNVNEMRLKAAAQNNKQTLAQVFTDVRYKKSNNEHFSAVLLNTLKNQGFL